MPNLKIKRSTAISQNDGKMMLRALIADLGHDPDLIPMAQLEQIAERLSVIARRETPWGRKFLRNVTHGTQPASPALLQAIQALGAITDGMREELATARQVTVLAAGDVRPGSLVLADSQPCPGCGIWYVPRTGNQVYHSKKCRLEHKRGGEKK